MMTCCVRAGLGAPVLFTVTKKQASMLLARARYSVRVCVLTRVYLGSSFLSFFFLLCVANSSPPAAQALATYLPSGATSIDGIVLTKFDTIDDKVRARAREKRGGLGRVLAAPRKEAQIGAWVLLPFLLPPDADCNRQTLRVHTCLFIFALVSRLSSSAGLLTTTAKGWSNPEHVVQDGLAGHVRRHRAEVHAPQEAQRQRRYPRPLFLRKQHCAIQKA